MHKVHENIKTKHGAQCHLPKCKGLEPESEVHSHKCETCGKGFKTMRGVSQHESHEHPLVRNENRRAEAAQCSEHRKPKGCGQLWTKEEIDRMLELETLLQGERFIAKKMCEFLPTKSKKQIRDKRAEAKYRAQMKDRLQSQKNTMETTEGVRESPQNANTEAVNGLEGQGITSVNPFAIPTIIVEDHLETSSKEEIEWKESVISNTLETKLPEKETIKRGPTSGQRYRGANPNSTGRPRLPGSKKSCSGKQRENPGTKITSTEKKEQEEQKGWETLCLRQDTGYV
jgi:hypothetical protein